MRDHRHSRLRLMLTVLVLLGEVAHLAWQQVHGGVVSHHLLHRADLPAISNGWGALLLPALTWYLLGRIGRRIAVHASNTGSPSRIPAGIVAGFVGALAFGVALSMAFAFDYTSVSATLFVGALLLATVLPLYRAECVLGFILGMAFTFGAVLPTVVAGVIAALSALFNFYVHPALAWTVARFRRARAADPARGRGIGGG